MEAFHPCSCRNDEVPSNVRAYRNRLLFSARSDRCDFWAFVLFAKKLELPKCIPSTLCKHHNYWKSKMTGNTYDGEFNISAGLWQKSWKLRDRFTQQKEKFSCISQKSFSNSPYFGGLKGFKSYLSCKHFTEADAYRHFLYTVALPKGRLVHDSNVINQESIQVAFPPLLELLIWLLVY